VRRHDPDGARDIMLTHLADFEKRLRKQLVGRDDASRTATLGAPRLVRVPRR
jgi:DNA-binding GntR family transcriptional regulator